mgnify:CR=1 FL=1
MEVSSFVYSGKKWTEKNEFNEFDVALIVDNDDKSIYFWEGAYASSVKIGLARKNLMEIREMYPTFKLKKVDEATDKSVTETIDEMITDTISDKVDSISVEKANKALYIVQIALNSITFILWAVGFIDNILMSASVLISSILGLVIGWNKYLKNEKNLGYALYGVSFLSVFAIFFFWNGVLAVQGSQWVLLPLIIILDVLTMVLDLAFQRKISKTRQQSEKD